MMFYNDVMENFELFKRKFLILKDITGAILVTDNISTMANLMLDLAINYTKAEKGSLMLLKERGELSILAARGIDTEFMKTYRIKIGEGIAGTVAESRQPVLVEDIDLDERFKEKKRDRYKTRSFISCPIISRSGLLGVLNINDKKDGTPFTEDEFDLIKVVANHAAIALENASLMNQLRMKAADLDDMNKRLIETDIIKTEFLTIVSHELRAPLNSISGAIYYLQQSQELTKREQEEFYHIISKETTNLSSVIENLLEFLRLENETRLFKKSVINLVDLLKETLNSRLLKITLSKKNLQLVLDIKENISDIVGDKMKIIQFFINLIEGLSHYLETSDTIKVAVSENDFVEVKLTFYRRIPESIRARLFDSRHIFDKDQPEELVKLYLARKVAEIHGWDLNVEDADDSFLVSIAIPKNTRQKKEAFVDISMEMFVEFLSELLNLNICSIMLSDELTGDLTIKSAKGLSDDVIRHTRIKLGDRIAGWVALEGKPLLIEDIESDPRFGRKNIPLYNTKSFLSIPLRIQDKVIGVLNLSNKKTTEPFTMRDLDIASIVSERISYFIERLYSKEYSEKDFRHFMAYFESVINAEKRYHKKKSLIPDLMFKIMDKLGAKEEEKKLALFVSLIYDLGLAVIDENIFKKKKLSMSEFRSLKSHPYTTVNLIEIFEFSEDVTKAILHHHERYDGKGYPDKLKGEEIPFISRVLSVVDAFCSMIEERAYRKTFTQEEALQEIKNGSGSNYDPRIVEALDEILRWNM